MKVGHAEKVFVAAAKQFEGAAERVHGMTDNPWLPERNLRLATKAVGQAVESLRALGHDQSQVLPVREAALSIVVQATKPTSPRSVNALLDSTLSTHLRKRESLSDEDFNVPFHQAKERLDDLAGTLRHEATGSRGSFNSHDEEVLAQLRETRAMEESALSSAQKQVDDLAVPARAVN